MHNRPGAFQFIPLSPRASCEYGSSNVWRWCCEVFDYLAVGAIVDGHVFGVHRGISPPHLILTPPFSTACVPSRLVVSSVDVCIVRWFLYAFLLYLRSSHRPSESSSVFAARSPSALFTRINALALFRPVDLHL